MARAVFVDRDGVICVNRADYVKCWEEFEFLPGAAEAIKKLNELNLVVVVVSNQSAVVRGLLPIEELDRIHGRMRAELEAKGARVDGIYYCPHLPDFGCLCRKPRTGMFEKASHRFGIEMSKSYVIGDAECDMRAGRKIMSTTVLVRTGRGGSVNLSDTHYHPDHIADDLPGAADFIARSEQNGRSPSVRA